MKFRARIQKEIFHNNKGFGIYATVDLDGVTKPNSYGNSTIIGNLPRLEIGKEYNVIAEEKLDDERGYQYFVKSIERDIDIKNIKDQKEFLSEFMSYNKASALVDNNPNALELLMNNKIGSIDISKVHGVGVKTLEKASQKCKDNFGLLPLKKLFKGELTINMLRKINEKYTSSDMVKEKVESEPYKTLVSIGGVGFKTADEIVKKLISSNDTELDMDKELLISSERCDEFVSFLLKENEKSGNSCMELGELKSKIRNQMPECYKYIDEVLESSIYKIDKNKISFTKTYNQESYIWEKIFEYYKTKRLDKFKNTEQYRNIGNFKATDKQFSLLEKVSKNVISILCGYSGSGKSTSMNMFIKMLKDHNENFMIFAPTGKAAKVLKGYIGEETYTIHRGLKYNPKMGWGFKEDNKLNTDFIIVDEFSMVDIDLCYRLFSAIDFTKTKLIIVGDPEQLPSVGKGNLLHEFINCKLIPTIMLDEIFRYGIGGLTTVGTNLRESKKYLKYNENKIIKIGEDNGYIFIPSNQENILKNLSSLYKKLLDNNVNKQNIMILSAQNKGKIGTFAINEVIKPLANPDYKNKKSFKNFHVGDVVMQVKRNNYKVMSEEDFKKEKLKDECSNIITNGETGVIIYITDKHIIIDFEGDICYFTQKEMENVSLAYAISSHKSQGSQADVVIYITDKSHTFMTDSNLMYVSVTRAKKKCFHIGDSRTINNKIKHKTNRNRMTNSVNIINHIVRSELSGK